MKTIFLLLSLAGTLFCNVPVKAQTSITINPIKDNTLYQNAAGSLSNGAGDHFFVGATNNGAIRRGLLNFDIAANVPERATIVEATLTLTMDKTISGPINIELHRVTADWGEGASVATETVSSSGGIGATALTNDATWLHRFYSSSLWIRAGGDFSQLVSAITSVDGIGSYSWSSPQLVTDVQNWLNEPVANFGWCLTGGEATMRTAKRFASREIATAANRPRLTLVFNEVPVSAQETNASSQLTIYPNPSSGKMQLAISDVPHAEVKIYNTLGQTVYSERLTADQLTIDLSKEPEGIYVYELLSKGQMVETGKITIMKK